MNPNTLVVGSILHAGATYAHSGSQPWLSNLPGEFSKTQIPKFPQCIKSLDLIESLDTGVRHLHFFFLFLVSTSISGITKRITICLDTCFVAPSIIKHVLTNKEFMSSVILNGHHCFLDLLLNSHSQS